MTDLLLAVLLLAALAGAQWLVRDLRTVPPSAREDHRSSSVSVVVPARDEETSLPALLEALRAVSVREVLVVDDGSRDATSSIARAGGATVLTAGSPPSGWTGKAWSCHLGAQSASGELLLFLDADTVLAPQALDGLLDLRDQHGGLVSVQPFHTVERAYEQLSAYFNAVSVLASGAFERRPPRRPMAFGPCLLSTRSDYEFAGGHAAVQGEILDDVSLAAAYARASLPVRCVIGGSSIRMRSYPGGPRQLVDGWTKNIASGASAAAPAPTVASVLWLCAHHAVALAAVLLLGEAVTGQGTSLVWGHPSLWAGAWVLVAAQLRWFLSRIGSFRWWTWLIFPLPLLAFDVVFARSTVRTLVRRSVRWRGREVRVDGSGSVRGEA